MEANLDTTPRTPFEILADYERRSLAHIAGLPEQIDAQGTWRAIAFRVGSRHFVSNISEVNEILTIPVLSRVPGAKPWMLGLANVRGNLVTVIDLRGFAEGLKTTPTETSRVLVVKQHGGNVGLLIDEVLGQKNFVEDLKQPIAEDTEDRYRRFVQHEYQAGELQWGVFSMSGLVKTPEFQQAAA